MFLKIKFVNLQNEVLTVSNTNFIFFKKQLDLLLQFKAVK